MSISEQRAELTSSRATETGRKKKPVSFWQGAFTDAQSPEEFDAYIDKCKELSLYDTGVSAEYGDKLITLSTCEYSRTNGRIVVVAKKVTESSGANAPANDGAAEIPS